MQTAHQAMADKPATPQRDDMATVALDTVLLDEEPTADQVLTAVLVLNCSWTSWHTPAPPLCSGSTVNF